MQALDDLELTQRGRQWAANGVGQTVREAAGLSLQELATLIDVSTATVHHWEHGRRRPRSAAAARYGRVLQELMQPKYHVDRSQRNGRHG